MPCRVVHLTSVHYAFDTRIFHKECKSLASAGYKVTLIAPHSEGDHTMDGVRLRSITLPRNRRERMTSTIAAVYQAAVRENADIYHFHDPELIPLGVLLKLGGKKVIYDVHEDYAGNMKGKEWIPRLLHGPAALAVNVCEATLTQACDRVVAATPTIAEKFGSARTRLVQNFPRLREFQHSDALPYGQREAIAIYIGWLGDLVGIHEMAQAVELVVKTLPVRLILGGGVLPGAKMTFEVGRYGGLVECTGFLNRRQVAALTARARVGLVINHPTERNAVNAWPTKLFEYMAAGLPVIASDFPLYRRIVESAGCGLLVDPLNPAALAEALMWLLRNPAQAEAMGRNGRCAIEEKYNWEREAERLVAAYAELLPVH